MKYEYKVTTAQGMNTLAAEGWRVVAMHMNSIIMERAIDDNKQQEDFKNTSKEPSKTTRVKRN